MKPATLKCNPIKSIDIYFYIHKHHMLQIKKETANIYQYKVGNNANIGNFMRLWETRLFIYNILHAIFHEHHVITLKADSFHKQSRFLVSVSSYHLPWDIR